MQTTRDCGSLLTTRAIGKRFVLQPSIYNWFLLEIVSNVQKPLGNQLVNAHFFTSQQAVVSCPAWWMALEEYAHDITRETSSIVREFCQCCLKLKTASCEVLNSSYDILLQWKWKFKTITNESLNTCNISVWKHLQLLANTGITISSDSLSSSCCLLRLGWWPVSLLDP